MKVSIENINGKGCTVIRREFNAEWVKTQLNMGIPVLAECQEKFEPRAVLLEVYETKLGQTRYKSAEFGVNWGQEYIKYTVTILPPLPKHPKPEDALLLYWYMAEGLYPYAKESSDPYVQCYEGSIIGLHGGDTSNDQWQYRNSGDGHIEVITHCQDQDGNRVDIAIEE